jgi:hypothetical protein
MLTTAQTSALKAFIQTDSAFTALLTPNNENAFTISALLQVSASPDFIVWRTTIPPSEYMTVITWTEVDTLTVGKSRIWEWISARMTVPINASLANVRQGIADAFAGAGAATTRAALTALAKRKANKLEKLLSTGTGTDASPATMGFEGILSFQEISNVMEW